MNLKYVVVIIFTVLASSETIFCQSSKIYHAYKIDGSYPVVEKWNIKDTTGYYNLIEETYDSLERVTSIKFLYKNYVRELFPMYGVSIITYTYNNNLIIERYYDYLGNQLTLFDDESPSFRIYYLDSNNLIDSCKAHFYIEVGEASFENLKRIEKEINIWKDIVFEENTDSTAEDNKAYTNCDMKYIYGFMYSYIKMKGDFPKITGYKFDYEYFKRHYEKDVFDEFIKKY
jgi:hypothetical protein